MSIQIDLGADWHSVMKAFQFITLEQRLAQHSTNQTQTLIQIQMT